MKVGESQIENHAIQSSLYETGSPSQVGKVHRSLYSALKRTTLGVLYMGTMGLGEAMWSCNLYNRLGYFLGIAVILQLAIIPPAMIAWGLIAPRKMNQRPS